MVMEENTKTIKKLSKKYNRDRVVNEAIISKDENLTTIQSGLLSCLHGDNSLETLVISNNPNLTTISSGNLSSNNPSLTNLTLENLPKLTSLSAVFYRAPLKKLNLVNLELKQKDKN